MGTVHKKMETITLHSRMWFILPPPPPPPPRSLEGIRNSKGKGVQEEAISKVVGFDSQGIFSRDFETRIIVFIGLPLTGS